MSAPSRAAPSPHDELPLEIAFLQNAGISRESLRDACAKARQWQVDAATALIAAGHMRAADYVRAVAHQTGLPFADEGLEAAHDVAFPEAVLSGCVRLRPNAYGAALAMAPAGSALHHLLAGEDGSRWRGLVLVPPDYLRELVFARRGVQIAARAANALPDAQPEASARDGLTSRQIAAMAVLSGLISFSAVLAPLPTLAAIGGFGSVLFLLMVMLRLATAMEAVPVRASKMLLRAAPDPECPVYTVIVPLYREWRVVRRLIGALEAMDYPRGKLDIMLMLEEGDAETLNALTALDLPDRYRIVVAPAGAPRTKPRALNIALKLARGDYLVVYDAEDVPDPLQLRLAAGTFALSEPDLACVQARLVIDNSGDGLLPSLFTIEYAALFDVVNPGFAAYHLPMPLGGTSTHFRTDVLRKAGGWDAWNVTEDADLGIRLARMGWRVGDLGSHTYEEAPLTLRAWMGQRMRWLKGWMQVCVTHSRQPVRAWRELGTFKALGALTCSFGTVLTALGFPFFTAASLWAMADGSLFHPQTLSEIIEAAMALPLFVSGLATILVPAAVGVARRRLWHLMPLVPFLPFYYVLVSVAAWRALVELIHSPFVWRKTEHGLARSSRSGALTDSDGVPLPRQPAGAPD